MIKKIAFFGIIAMICFFTSSLICNHCCIISYAQNTSSTAANTNQATNGASDSSENEGDKEITPTRRSVQYGYLDEYEFLNAVMVMAFALIALSMQFILLRKTPRLKAEDILRVFGVTLIITGTLFFIAAGFNSEQIAPAMGLFGTIAGYILGRMERKEKENERNE